MESREHISKAKIELEIKRFIHEDSLGRPTEEELDVDENLFTSGILDSMGAMRLVSHIQTTFGFTIPPSDLVPGNFKTIRIMATYIEAQVSKR